MFSWKDDFKVYDDNHQPYSFSVERHTEIEDLHAAVDERGFVLKSIGNRFICNTPKLSEFELEMDFGFTFLSEFDPVFHLLYSYDNKKRRGQGLRFEYHLSGGLSVAYIKVERMKTEVISEICFPDFSVKEGKDITLSLQVKDHAVTGTVGGHGFSFPNCPQSGYIVLERRNFIGELILRKFSVTSKEGEEEVIVPETTVEIPLLDGGDIPYRFSFSILRINERYYLETKLFGGTASRKLNREDRPGQYVAERDILTSPYTVLRFGDTEQRFCIFCGEKIIVDPNIYWECLKDFFGHPTFPIENRFLLKELPTADDMTISFGYESLACTGYYAQAEGSSEFVFDTKGDLLYGGDALSESIFELRSPSNKAAVSLIPERCYERERIIRHLERNHYFHIEEDISLTLCVKTKLPTECMSVTARICDVYDSEILCEVTPDISRKPWLFGYTELSASVLAKPLPMGLYRVKFSVYYGDGIYQTFEKVFEVFDPDSSVSPAMKAGLPFVFSMPNEQKWLMSNSFDLWNPKPSCDVGHYISCVTDTPIEAETRRIWEVIKPFGREWFAWLSDRTCLDYSIESHMEVVKHSDYLYVPAKTEVYPLRNDLYLVKTYQNPMFREYLHAFLRENPLIAERVLYKIPEREVFEYVKEKPIDESGVLPEYKAFTYEHLKNLMDTCHAEWMRFANERILEDFREQNKELKELNPSFKRSAYGPLNNYVTPAVSYHSVKAYGNLPYESLAEDVYTGFAVFEDYPASCAYQTYRGAFAVMTIMLHCPKLRLYPEQYKGSLGGCIDGAVKFSHAPMGKYTIPLYFNTTHAFEFVYNTPSRTEEGYRYWDHYGFHRADFTPEMWDRLVKDWKTVIDIKPKKPLKTMAMVTEYFDEEDCFDDEILSLHGNTNLYNISEEAHGFIYECVRGGGLNAPFALKLDTLKDLRACECDVLVLPTLRYCGEEIKKEIRRLHGEGTALVAVSHVDGLEDIFGVIPRERETEIDTLRAKLAEEDIYPNRATFRYDADEAEVLLESGGGTPVILKKDRALLLNTSVNKLGRECFEGAEGKARKNVSSLLRRMVTETIKSISSPLVQGENVGVTLFESERGTVQLLCIDYSAYTNKRAAEKQAVVKLDIDAKEVISQREALVVRDRLGMIKELRFTIKPHEAVMFTLK